MTNNRIVVAAIVASLFLMTIPAPLEASHPNVLPTDHQYEILSRLWALQAQVSALQPQQALDVQVFVDPAACASGSVQCSGHSSSAAAAGNHNPVRVTVAPVLDGKPVTGLTDSRFIWNTAFVPAGGANAVKYAPASCGSNCFQESGGVYAFYVHPYANYVWQAGTYHASLQVIGPDGVRGMALASWTIA